MVYNNSYFAVCLATHAFSYVPRITVPLSIMVSTTGFMLSLIAPIREDAMACVKGAKQHYYCQDYRMEGKFGKLIDHPIDY